MERLTIKELATYLPYGLKMAFIVRDEIRRIDTLRSLYDIENYDDIKLSIGHSDSEHIWMFKPLLRPLSQLTEEIENKGERIIFSDVYLSKTQLEKLQNPSLWPWGSILNEFDYNFIQRLLKYHFDVFGLIERGLALPIDGKEVETLTCSYCDSEFSKGTGGNYGEYGEVCINCYEGLS